ncbi:MAG: hypothetical protein K5770_03180, partial [Lachnospiraceae bacterium]|nr:hypothetical protein [Lachnospiraceae bacterium]
MNYFVEGLQGSGKSTLVKKLYDIHPEYLAVHEGDYSPVELAWCAYVSGDEYENILDKYHAIRMEIEEKSHKEGDNMVISYTRIITDIPSSINTIRKERSDEQGNELWFPMMLGYFNESPYARKNGLSGVEAMLSHFRHRQELEMSICKEVFPGRYTVLKSKKYKDEDIRADRFSLPV